MHTLFQMFHNWHKGNRSIDEYTKFYELRDRNNLKENGEQIIAHYVTWLQFTIQDQVIMHDLTSVGNTYLRAQKFEGQLG